MTKQQLSTNTFTTADYIVDATAYSGNYTSLSAALTALTAAGGGATIFLKAGTYTENDTITTNCNISAFQGDGQTGNVIIKGNMTVSSAVTVSFSGLELQTNSSNFLTVSGSAASVVNLIGCNLNCTNNTGISFSSSSSSAQINVKDCIGNLGTTGIGFHTMSSAGTLQYMHSFFTNTGSSTTQSTNSAGIVGVNWCNFPAALACSSTGVVLGNWSQCAPPGNTTAITTAGTGASGWDWGSVISGSASAISIGSGTTFTTFDIEVGSTNTDAITGSGTLNYGMIEFNETSNTINTSTQVAQTVTVGALKFQPSSGTSGTATNNTITVYEEGTFTPTVTGSATAGTTTYTIQNGYYTKIGNMVTVWVYMTISAATGTGNATIGGLPFTIKNQTDYAPIAALFLSSNTWAFPSTFTMITVNGASNTTTATLQGTKSAGGNSAIQMANAVATFAFTLSYQV